MICRRDIQSVHKVLCRRLGHEFYLAKYTGCIQTDRLQDCERRKYKVMSGVLEDDLVGVFFRVSLMVDSFGEMGSPYLHECFSNTLAKHKVVFSTIRMIAGPVGVNHLDQLPKSFFHSITILSNFFRLPDGLGEVHPGIRYQNFISYVFKVVFYEYKGKSRENIIVKLHSILFNLKFTVQGGNQ